MKPTTEIAKLMKFFSPTTECWFEGCTEMREAYTKEIEALEAAAAAAGTECRECDRGAIVRRYLTRLYTMKVG